MVPRQSSDATGATNPVRVRRTERRLTQAELAAQVRVSRQTIIAVEQGSYAPSVYLALRIARALGATVEDLFIEDGREARR
ncbi:helix-turn-helix transcriptional regulator [Georgenia sp. TF02-10]|uniref:helix-turn-helix transcriptional regulator n=1 Tax=Georgenia sp. TF02-10 TaxID=2917725 RepID=UPI001FA6B4A2|nr:helix-turn-helix transcriptional regulator [Georgenia sp. TF02-10]UNX53721.1 helix-turn-helix transcriptional regulator [Georgenia sp. TF02-10]